MAPLGIVAGASTRCLRVFNSIVVASAVRRVAKRTVEENIVLTRTLEARAVSPAESLGTAVADGPLDRAAFRTRGRPHAVLHALAALGDRGVRLGAVSADCFFAVAADLPARRGVGDVHVRAQSVRDRAIRERGKREERERKERGKTGQ